jgi:hypothetical protein
MPRGGLRSTSFKAGSSGNPGGRPKRTQTIEARRIIADVKALARECAPEAVSTLKTIMLDSKMPPAARIASANILLERGYGRPWQAVDLTVKSWDLDRLTDEQLVDLERLLTIIELPESTQGALLASSAREGETCD